ncbi:uncharacterized protein LOC121371290 [Gigantopelta aegis]|uniref:uncharacterized protein LOC121371290 n=1 Tax=Gigantopelta aegis TaxID=1735272 RepID=UPI001B88CBBC|nr:uncharacterized protein LOC121371290 [Gigantopelta aegis]
MKFYLFTSSYQGRKAVYNKVEMDTKEQYSNYLIASVVERNIPHSMTDEKRNRVVKIMTRTTKKLLAGELIRIQEYTDMCVKSVERAKAEDHYQQIGHNLEYMEDNLMELFREKHPLVNPLFAENPQPNCNHQQALDGCRNVFVSDLDLKSTRFLDLLHQDDVMSIASMESIQVRPTSRARNEEFMHVLKTCTSEQINNVIIPALQKTHPHLAEKLKAEMAKPCQTVPSKCLACRIREEVQVKRLADFLLKQSMICLTSHSDYKNPSMTNTVKWIALLKEVNTAGIIKALQNKYPDLHAECQIKKLKTLECICAMGDEEEEMDVARLSDLESISSGYDDSYEHDSDLTDMCSPKGMLSPTEDTDYGKHPVCSELFRKPVQKLLSSEEKCRLLTQSSSLKTVLSSKEKYKDPDKTQRSVDSELRSKRLVQVSSAETKNSTLLSTEDTDYGKHPVYSKLFRKPEQNLLSFEEKCKDPDKTQRSVDSELHSKPLLKVLFPESTNKTACSETHILLKYSVGQSALGDQSLRATDSLQDCVTRGHT